MKYLILALCVSFTLGLEFDRPCREDVSAKENFSPAFVSLVVVFLESVNNLKNSPNKNQYTGIWFELYNSINQSTVECIDHHYTRRGLQQVFDVERTGFIGTTPLRETAVVRVVNPDETPMRAILRGTINRITGEVVEYNYRIHATGK